jgi:TRAP-type C4-dicarboxylate transport system substrate-binding protein
MGRFPAIIRATWRHSRKFAASGNMRWEAVFLILQSSAHGGTTPRAKGIRNWEVCLMIRKTLLAMAGAIAFSAAVGGTAQAETMKLVLGTNQGPPTGMGIALVDYFIPRVEKLSYGAAKVEFDGPSAICVEHQCVEQMMGGLIQLSTSSTGNVGAFGRTFDVTNLPYIFRDLEWADIIINDWMAEELDKRSQAEMGIKVLSLNPLGGFRQLANNVRQVKVPTDLKGIKIRVTKSPTEFQLIKAWQGNAVPYDWAQLYQGLQTGVVNGYYVPDGWTVHVKLHEVINHITEVGGAYTGGGLWASKKHFDAWPAEVQNAIVSAGKTIQKGVIFEIDRQWLKVATVELKKCCSIYYPTDEEMEQWFAGALGAWVEAKGTYEPAIAERALKQQQMDGLLAVLKDAGAL